MCTLLHELFQKQAERTPNSIAVTCGREQLSYAHLNGLALTVAKQLIDHGVEPGDLVGIYLERGMLMVVAMLASLKAGAAYVPLDSECPAERLTYILDDAMPRVVVTQCSLRERLPPISGDVVTLDGTRASDLYTVDERASVAGITPNHLAYIIYTSGSTGRPKGVMVEHRNVIRLFTATESLFRFNSSDVWTLYHSFSFDFSVWELWGALLYGGRVVIVPHAIARSPHEFFRLLCKEGVTILNQTPAAFVQFADAQVVRSERHSLRFVIFGGDALDLRSLRHWVKRNGVVHPQLVNMYGITETTVHVTYHLLTEKEIENGGGSPIGKPIPDLRLYVLDAHYDTVPPGSTGELYVEGDGLARGYLGRPDLTSERFVANPFRQDGSRLYKTGDLGRLLHDGSVEYLGRNDHQVKLRGFRIELGEIEAQLSEHPLVRGAIVTAVEDERGTKFLAAYVVPNSNPSTEEALATAESLRSEILNSWEAVFDRTYDWTAHENGPTFVGWNSSFTGEPLSEVDMQEWLDRAVEKISSLRPEHVLEIGCGVGLVLQHIAAVSSIYVGTDISASALLQLRGWMTQREDLKHVRLLHCSATELDDLKSGTFDTVILNSVAQYFPSLEYFISVLRESVRLLRSDGVIFVGDVRNEATLEFFHADVQFSKAPDGLTIAQVRNRIAWGLMQESELAINPQFFQQLPSLVPQITEVEIHLKRGLAVNELTQYRYDVVLRIGGEGQRKIPLWSEIDWQSDMDTVKLELALQQHRWDAVRIRRIANRRLTRAAAVRRLLETSNDCLPVSTLRSQIVESLPSDSVDPEWLWTRGSAHGYEVHITCDPVSPECFEARLVDRNLASTYRWKAELTVANKPWAACGTQPLENNVKHRITSVLREYLKPRLPEHMIPSAWVVLDHFPLTPHGKLDRRSLPVPQLRSENLSSYTPPSTDIERHIVLIVEDILRVDGIGIDDNFFQLGGNSLLAMQLIARLSASLGREVTYPTLFESTSIRELGKRLEAYRCEAAAPIRMGGGIEVL